MQNNSTIQPNLTFPGMVHSVGDYYGARLIAAHSHEETELVFVMDGNCESAFNGQTAARLTATAGMAFLVPPRTLHDQRGRCSTVFFTMELPPEIIPEQPVLLDLRADAFLLRWCRDLSQLWYQPAGDECFFLAGAIWQRILPFYREVRTGMPQIPDCVHKARQYIERNFQKKITVAEVARHAGASPTWLNLAFRRYMGKSLMRYLYDLRLDTARKMLASDFFPVKEVAERCGFASANYFARACTQKFQLSPRDLRRQR